MAYEQRSQTRRRRARETSSITSSRAPPPAPLLPPFLSSAPPPSYGLPKKKTPYSIQRDYRVLEREKRVTTILNDDRFRGELERILQGQKDGLSHPKMTDLQKLQQEASSQSRGRVSQATGVVGSTTGAVIPINDLRGVAGSKYTLAEKQMRCKLAALYRLVEMFGWSQLIYNSITARSPREAHSILVNPFGLLYSEITASSLVAVDLDGHVVDPGSTQLGINQSGFALHAAIHAARGDVKCVVHVHTNAGVAVSSMSCGLLPVSEEALGLGEISYLDFSFHMSAQEQRQQVAQDLGPSNKVLILRNHGLVAMGRSIEEAFHITHKLVKACEIQVTMMTVGLNNILQCSKGVWSKSRPCLGGADVESTFRILDSAPQKWGPGELEFEALMRMLDNRGYNTGYRYKGMELLESGTGKSGTWNRTDDERRSEEAREWNFLDQKKIDRTEPVIRDKNKATPRRREETGADAEHIPSPPNSPKTPHSTKLTPLGKTELTASRVAKSTGKAVERLAKDLKQTPSTLTSRSEPDLLSPLERTQRTAERVASSTGHAVKKLTQDFTVKSLRGIRLPDPVRNGDLETNSEPSLLVDRGLSEPKGSTEHINGHTSSPLTPGHLSPHRRGLVYHHRSLGDLNLPDGLSPLEKVTHTAEKVAGSTGVAVVKLSGSLTTP